MKKYILPLLALAAMAFAGCAKQEAATPKGRVVTITAALDNATKVTTGSAIGKFAWEEGDAIGVWDGEEFIKFTLDPSTAGAVAGKFTGTVPGGKEIGFAVYPYNETDEYTEDGVYVCNFEGGNYDYKSTVHMYAPKTGNSNTYKFQHLCAYVMVTIKNLRADCKYVFLETAGGNFFLVGGQMASLTAEYPKFEGSIGINDWGFVELPEDHSNIVLYAPVLPGEWDNKLFNVKFFQQADFAWEYGKGNLSSEPSINKTGHLQTGGYINRGDLIVLPEIVF